MPIPSRGVRGVAWRKTNRYSSGAGAGCAPSRASVRESVSMSVNIDEEVQTRSAGLRKDLGLADLTLTQILFIVGLPWVGVAAKQGPAHVLLWLAAIVLFYLPAAAGVIHLHCALPLDVSLQQ